MNDKQCEMFFLDFKLQFASTAILDQVHAFWVTILYFLQFQFCIVNFVEEPKYPGVIYLQLHKIEIVQLIAIDIINEYMQRLVHMIYLKHLNFLNS